MKHKRNKQPTFAALIARASEGSPIETRCQARGIVQEDRRKKRDRNKCRRKGRSGNPRNRDW